MKKTLKRIGNFLFRRIHGYPLRPFGVLIETTNRCNFHCRICARHKLTRPLGFMDFNFFKYIIDGVVKAKISTVRLQFFGEPLLHPRLIDMINYAKNMNIAHVNFNTNVSLLNKMKVKEILNTGLDQIQFSLDAASKETFDRVRSKGFFEIVVDNIESFFELKKISRRNNLRTVLKITATKDNLSELKTMISKWGYLFDEIQIAPMTIYEDIDSSFLNKEQFSRGICMQPFQKLIIFWNGDVSVCCYDINGNLKVGNILQEDILSLWRGTNINRIRKKIKARQYDRLTCCKNCEFSNRPLMEQSANLILNDIHSNKTLRQDFNFKVDAGILYVYLNKNRHR